MRRTPEEGSDGSGANVIELPTGPFRRLHPLALSLRRKFSETIRDAAIFAVQKKNAWTTFGTALEGLGILDFIYSATGILEQDTPKVFMLLSGFAIGVGGANITGHLSGRRYEAGRIGKIMGSVESAGGILGAGLLLSGNPELYSLGFTVSLVSTGVGMGHLMANSPRSR